MVVAEKHDLLAAAARRRQAWGLRCCTDEELAYWLEYALALAADLHGGDTRQSFCGDCEPGYRQAMRRRGRCVCVAVRGTARVEVL